MLREIRPALVSLAIFTVLLGLGYPLLVTGVAQAAFPRQANGSLIMRANAIGGSELIGQPFAEPRYFWGRPSGTGPQPYNGGASSGTNHGPTNPAFLEAVQDRIKALHDADPDNTAPIPVDLVTASGSGLDPHISPEAAEYQVRRVARARGVDEASVRSLVVAHTQERQLGVLGEPRVNVLALNLALEFPDEVRSRGFDGAR